MGYTEILQALTPILQKLNRVSGIVLYGKCPARSIFRGMGVGGVEIANVKKIPKHTVL